MTHQMHYRGIDHLHHAVLANLSKIPHDVDLIVGIPRSGLLVANILALYLNRPMTDLAGLAERRLLATGKRFVPVPPAIAEIDELTRFDVVAPGSDRLGGELSLELVPAPAPTDLFDRAQKILIVDDCISLGTEIAKAREKVAAAGFADKALYACVYSFPERPHLVDLVLELVPRPMCFQWSCMHSKELAGHCCEIDGVMAAEAPESVRSDPRRLGQHFATATPIFRPTTVVGKIITARDVRHREITEAWLERYGIRCGELIMRDPAEFGDDFRSRLRFKAAAYRASGSELFIEGTLEAAHQLWAETGLPVLSMAGGDLRRNPVNERDEVHSQRADWWLRRMERAPKVILGRMIQRFSS